MRSSGFTLVEMVMVMAVLGILAASLAIFLPPAIHSYADTRRRADMTDMADTALRQISQDIRRAVPNSLIRHSASCLQLVPATGGGRYRIAADPGGASAWLDPTTAVSTFDVLTRLRTLPAANDWIVIDNQNASNVYTGSNRQQVASVDTPATPNGIYRHRIALTAPRQFSEGYEGGRFMVVANSEQSVFYSCVLPPGGATGMLYRITAGFGAGAATCSTPGAVVATDVESCVFDYQVGATEQSGMLSMRLQLRRDGERITLSHGSHVENVP